MKRVTAQRMVIRHLHFINSSHDDDDHKHSSQAFASNTSTDSLTPDDDLGMFNISEVALSLDIDNELSENMEDSEEVTVDVDYDGYLTEGEGEKEGVESEEKDVGCIGEECGKEGDENGTWPASRKFRRSSLTLVRPHSPKYPCVVCTVHYNCII